METRTLGQHALPALIFALIATVSLQAQEPINVSRAVDAAVTVEVENISGSVAVIGWDRNEVKIEGTLGRRTERLDVDGDENLLRIEVVLPQHARNVEETELEIHMPVKGSLSVRTISAGVEVDGITGEVDLNTVSGEIGLRGRPSRIDVSTVSGEIDLNAECDQVRIEGVSSDIIVKGISGDVAAKSVSGEIFIEAGKIRRLDASSVSGDIAILGDLHEQGSYRLETHSGDIELTLPAAISAEFEFRTFSGEIDSEFGGKARRTSKYTPGLEMELTIGEGGASVRAETFSGDLLLRKQ